jgi:hypothetical protein
MSNDLITNNLSDNNRHEIEMAKSYPRDVEKSINNSSKLITIDEETAQSCFYNLPPRKGPDGLVEIKGPSIRLAEIVFTCWGNLQIGARIISNDGKFVIVRGIAKDLENLNMYDAEVQRGITYKNGGTYSNDMINNVINAASSVAIRNALFRIIPRAIINKLYKIAIEHAVGTQETLPNKLNKMFSHFMKFGISSDKICNFFNKPKEDFTQEDLTCLIGLATAVKDNLVTIDKIFIVEEETMELPASQKISNLLAESKKNLANSN